METLRQTSLSRRTRVNIPLAGALSISVIAVAIPGAVLSAQGDNDIVIDVIERATPAVVTIQAPPGSFAGFSDILPGDLELPEDSESPEGLERPESFELPEGLDLPDLLPIPQGFSFGGSGSGVIVSTDGLIITNGHVVGEATDVNVILDDGTILDGVVTGVDTLTDFAFIDVEAEDLPVDASMSVKPPGRTCAT